MKLGNFLFLKNCKVYSAPFDVRLTRKFIEDKVVITVVQPDICVICDLSKLDDKGCIGAPDIVIEILSPSNNIVELKNKYEVYEECGVQEYWVVLAENRTFLAYTLIEGKYQASRLKVGGDFFQSQVLQGFELNMEEMFSRLY